jgi:hypothetical protein
MKRSDGKTCATHWFEDVRSQSTAGVQDDTSFDGAALVLARWLDSGRKFL